MVTLRPTLRDRLISGEGGRPLAGIWLCSASPVMAEVAAGAGLDWLLIDAEHSPQSLLDIQLQLQAVAAYPVTAAVRLPSADAVTVKQVLDLGAQNLVVPMISTAAQAEDVVRSASYPPRGVRGVGSALARSARWGRVQGYLERASEYVSVFVQIETLEGVENSAEILAVEGVDGVFVGPSDLAASMGLIGKQTHPEVVSAVGRVFAAAKAADKPVGVNAFDPLYAHRYLEEGADFVLVSSDVTLVARGAEKLASEFAG